MSELIRVKNIDGLELTVTDEEQLIYEPIMGGMEISPNWEEYISHFKDEFTPHLNLIKKAIEDLGWVGLTADIFANDTYFVFSDGVCVGFSWRAWGDLMSAIVGKREGYIKYYS